MAVKQASDRYVENDIAPAREVLAEADVVAIRARCKEEVEQGIPQLLEAVYRAASEKRQLDRALHFARLSWSGRVTQAQRVSDRPWSLDEGQMGTLRFYRDCLDPIALVFQRSKSRGSCRGSSPR